MAENPPIPPGCKPWKGKVPTELTKRAIEVINNPTLYLMHSESVMPVGDKFAMLRVEVHTWSTRGQHGLGGDPNERIPGIFRGCTLYQVVDPEAYGTYQYNQQNLGVSGDTMRRYYSGAAAPVVVRKQPATVTGQAAGLINLAAKPVRWTFHTAGGLVNWVGRSLQTIGNKL